MPGVLGAKLLVRYLNNPDGDLAWLKEMGVVKRRVGVVVGGMGFKLSILVGEYPFTPRPHMAIRGESKGLS
jgi:hypothetical protein